MRKRNTECIGDVLKEYFEENNFLKTKIAESRIPRGWDEVLGSSIAKYTTKLYLKHGILYVTLNSSVLSSELSYAKDMIIKKLNKYVGLDVITEIIFK